MNDSSNRSVVSFHDGFAQRRQRSPDFVEEAFLFPGADVIDAGEQKGKSNQRDDTCRNINNGIHCLFISNRKWFINQDKFSSSKAPSTKRPTEMKADK